MIYTEGGLKKLPGTLRAWIGALLLSLTAAALAGANTGKSPFDTLQGRLIGDGYPPKLVSDIYNRPEVVFEIKGLSMYFVHRESRVNYDHYTEPGQLRRARHYMEKYAVELQNAERTYGVDKNVVTAIILVETQLGKLLGNRSVLNTLSTLASLSDPSVRQTVWQSLGNTPDLTRTAYDRKADRKAEWAYRELKAFIDHVAAEGYDPVAINGSFAGAMGISQFMPSNIPELAKDGNSDGRINLFDHADAIASVAYYLKRHGWRPGISRVQAQKVIYHYNHSDPYVDTILKISDLLKTTA